MTSGYSQLSKRTASLQKKSGAASSVAAALTARARESDSASRCFKQFSRGRSADARMRDVHECRITSRMS